MNRTHRHASAAAAVVAATAVLLWAAAGEAQAPGPQVEPPQPPSGGLPPGHTPFSRPPGGQGLRGGYAVAAPRTPTGPTVQLPEPRVKGDVSVEHTLAKRHTLEAAKGGRISLREATQLLWAAQGVTGKWNRRATPSAGGAYPIEVILVAGDVVDLPPGVYRYYGDLNKVERLAEGDKRGDVAQVVKFQGLQQAPAIVVITGVEARMAQVFPDSAAAHTQVAMEAGGVMQNLMLEAVALGLGTAEVGDPDPARLAQLLRLPPGETVLAVVVVGRD